jgi:hypothetical protein
MKERVMTTLTQPTTPVEFATALRTLAAQAATRYAGEAARIDRGLVIALNGGVTLQADGTALVQSQKDAEVVYEVNGHCDCRDAANAPDGRCKHRWAKTLTSRATRAQEAPMTVEHLSTELYGDQAAACAAQHAATQRPTAPAPAPAAAPAACPEAAFSLCLKGRMDGQDAQLTVRGATYAEFAANVAAVRGLFDAPAAPPAFSQPSAPVAPAAAPEPEASLVCPIHQVLMTKNSNTRGSWMSHPTADGGWCKGKAKQG